MMPRLRAAIRRDWAPVVLLVGLAAGATWGLCATNGDSFVGRWPEAADVVRYAIVLAGVILAVLVADAVARVDRAYALAGAVRPWRLTLAVGLRFVFYAVIGLALSLAVVAWYVTRAPAGGSPWWWLIPSGLAWLVACWAIGVWFGALFESRPRAASVAGFFAAFVGVALSFFADSLPVPRLVPNWDPDVLMNREWGGGYVTNRVDPGVALWGIATAVVCAIAVAVLAGRRTGTWVRALMPVAILAVMGLLAPVLGVGGEAFVRRYPDPAAHTCTREHSGTRICGWPEDTALTAELDEKWERIVDKQTEVGLPMPQGTFFIHSSRSDGMPGRDLPLVFPSVQKIVDELARQSFGQLVQRCPDPFAYRDHIDLVAQWLAHQILDGEEGYIIGWQNPELDKQFSDALALPPDKAVAWARGIVNQMRTCAPVGQS